MADDNTLVGGKKGGSIISRLLGDWRIIGILIIAIPIFILSLGSVGAILYFMFFTAPKGVPLWLIIFALIILIVFARRRQK